MRSKLSTYQRDPVAFIDDLVKQNELGQPFSLYPHQREILRLAFEFDETGRLPYDTIIFSTPKKSGKTTINAAVALWWAFTQEPPNELYVIANDLEQSLARVFKAMVGIIQHNPGLAKSAEVGARQIRLSNGSTITALASEYVGAAGSNHGLTSWDELWGYVSESSRRLWEELTPVSTRRNSIRFISTYAGFDNESMLLQELYRQSVGREEQGDGQGEKIHPELPIYANKDARIFCYWDHSPRMPWQTPAYYDAQRRTLRPGTYLRLHENRWTSAEAVFITAELWDPCVEPGLRPILEADNSPLFIGVDAGIKHDCAAVVALKWDKHSDKLILASHRIWKPTPSEPLDLEGTVEWYLRNLYSRQRVEKILADPYQMHRSVTTLKAADLPIEEFPQTVANLTLMGQTLFDLLNGRNIRLYHAADLREQALSTVAIESPRGWRIAKEKTSRKIDAIVALAMACVAAIQTGRVEAPEVFPGEVPVNVITHFNPFY